MQIPKSQEGDPVPGRVSSQRGFLCHTPRASARTTLCFPGLEGHGLSKRFSWKSWESSPFLCGDPPHCALTRSNTHTPASFFGQGFPPGQITL